MLNLLRRNVRFPPIADAEIWPHGAIVSLWLRYVLAAFAAVIGFTAGLIGAGAITGGFAWIFLFGDNPWPSWSEPLILATAIVGGTALSMILALTAWHATSPK